MAVGAHAKKTCFALRCGNAGSDWEFTRTQTIPSAKTTSKTLKMAKTNSNKLASFTTGGWAETKGEENTEGSSGYDIRDG